MEHQQELISYVQKPLDLGINSSSDSSFGVPNLNQEAEQIIIGSLFGDGCLTRNNERCGLRFRERHSLKQKEYLLWKKSISEKYFKVKYYEDYNSCTIYTSVSYKFNYYHKYFYPLGKGFKESPREMLDKLQPLGLAIWYMDDGDYNKKSKHINISIDIKNFDNIKKWFLDKYSINAKLSVTNHKNGLSSGRIRFNVKDSKRIIDMIKPYIHKSMEYKVRITDDEKQKYKKLRSDYAKNNKERCRNYSIKYIHKMRITNPEKFEKRRQKKNKYDEEWYIKNKEYIRKYHKEYYKKKKEMKHHQSI